ncbi:class II aldolase/adducin family protein [Sphingobium sp. EP60837]|uniref:class II aldolase/adducin family protein n=1 Tax=Sphingobium sp. EP60837 TaxID=1855519 RepID=UPI00082E454C|nr:class II aldolase/adducin family protein [Sphingobium sp. EP60837]
MRDRNGNVEATDPYTRRTGSDAGSRHVDPGFDGAELALLCRALHREDYDDHIAGHITLAEPDGTFLVNPW